jgi:hypothetical protein
MGDQVQPDEGTREAERSENRQSHTADRPPTAEEAAAAERQREDSEADVRKKVAEHEQEMTEIGANVKGEGEIR